MPVADVLNQVNRLLHFHISSSRSTLLWLFQKQTPTRSICLVGVRGQTDRRGKVAVIV